MTALKNYLVLRLCFGTYQRPTVLVSLKIRDVIDQPDGETSHLMVAEGQEVLTKTVMSHKTTTTVSYSNVLKPLINIRWEIPCELKWGVFFQSCFMSFPLSFFNFLIEKEWKGTTMFFRSRFRCNSSKYIRMWIVHLEEYFWGLCVIPINAWSTFTDNRWLWTLHFYRFTFLLFALPDSQHGPASLQIGKEEWALFQLFGKVQLYQGKDKAAPLFPKVQASTVHVAVKRQATFLLFFCREAYLVCLHWESKVQCRRFEGFRTGNIFTNFAHSAKNR